MSKIEFKTVAPDDPAAIVELRTHVQNAALDAENLRKAADEVSKINEAVNELRVQQSDVLKEMRSALSTAPARKTDDVDEDSIKRMIEGVRIDEDLQKEKSKLQRGHFALVAQTTPDLRAKGADEATLAELAELQRLNDVILVENARRGLANPGGYAAEGGMRSLPWWKRYEQLATKFARALNETNANDGLNWVPTILSGNLKRLIQVEQRLAGFFPRVTITSKTYENTVEGSDFFATFVSEGTANDTSDGTIDAAQFTTPKATWTARKLAGRTVTTREIEADAIVDMVSEVLMKTAKSIRRAQESGMVNGQRTSTIDTTLTIASNDHRKAWDGFRWKYAQMGLTPVDMGAGVTAEGMLSLKGQMSPEGKAYGIDPAEGIWVTSPVGYVRLLALKGTSGNAVVLTQDVAGAANTFQRGQLGEAFGSAVVVSEFVSQQMNGSGIVQASGGSKTALYYVNTAAFALGERLGITLEASPHVLFQVDKLMYRGVWRGDFQSYFTASASDPFVAAGVNIAGF